MAVVKDQSTLPRPAATRNEAHAPDAAPRFVNILVEGWAELDGGPKPRAHEDTRFRHSDAGKCARAIAYAALDLPDSNPMDLSGRWNTGLGTIAHEAWQAQLRRRYPEADIEPKVRTADFGSGHVDGVVVVDGRKIAIELKTIGGFGYKLAIGERGAAQGPKFEHVVQGALNALAVDADEMVIAYLSKEAISVQAAQRKGYGELARFCAEWTFTREQYEPIAETELNRVAGILALLDEGTLPARKIPDPELPTGAVITNPLTGMWTQVDGDGRIIDTGTFWMCGYCRYQDTCAQTQGGRTPVDVLVQIGVLPEKDVA